MDDPTLGGVDIDAIREAIDLLDDAGFQVPDIQQVDRNNDNRRVRWTMTVETDARTTDINDFAPGDADD